MAIANVQRKAKGTNAASVSIGAGDGWATPTTGNLLVVSANSDATVSITGTWTAGPSVIDGNGTYIWYRISDGTETTITCTPSVSDTICITACEYSGNAASPFDVSNSSTIASSNGTTTTSVSVTTTAAGDLIIAAACLHSGGSPQPNTPSWTNSFTNQLTTASGGTTSADVTTFYAELIAGAAGSYSTSASWTGGCGDRQELVIAFTASAGSTPITLADTAAATDTAGVAAAVPLAQTATGADALTVAAAVGLADTGTGADALAVSASAALPDAGTAADTLGVLTVLALTQAGAALETLGVTATTTLADSGAAADGISVSVDGVTPKSLGDVAAAVDSLCVCAVQLRPDSGLVVRPDTGTVARPDTGTVTRCC